MPRLRSLYQAISVDKAEDKCTNFLIYLLQNLPANYFSELLYLSGITNEKVSSISEFEVQYRLKSRIPDAIIRYGNSSYMIIESKLYSNRLDLQQFKDYTGGHS